MRSRTRTGLLTLAGAAIGAAGVLVWSEAVHRRASRRGFGPGGGRGPAPRSEAVVVLGFRNRGPRANAVNRYRVRVGLRSRDPRADRSVLILCGGAVGGPVYEAELLARYARERGYAGRILLDTESRSTWENIRNALPLLADADAIVIASNAVHAEKGRRYLTLQRPDFADRLRRAADDRIGEILLIKPIAAVVGLRALSRLRTTADPASMP
ncbi:YdcF family protein [Leifsonia aquatica]|uniref:YdcF family protein n=1 Tax=Leifsonia aquatica TaxID=144185 RepID=UPI00046A66A5|nr:YdcF family protein [Leifsonia aquatica]